MSTLRFNAAMKAFSKKPAEVNHPAERPDKIFVAFVQAALKLKNDRQC